MNEPIDGIVAALARGEDLGTIALAVIPPGHRETLRRCAVVPAFDTEVYERVLRPPGAPGLSEFLSGGQVVRLSSGRYQVDRVIGEKLWDSWWTDAGLSLGTTSVPPALADCTRALRDHYRRIGDRLEELRQTLLIDPGRSRRLFVRLYDEADEAFDLARCQDVINVLADPARTPLIPVELARLRDDHQLYLKARGLWATEYHQTGRYLTRPRYERPLLELLESGSPRVLLHAQGGMGKTMQIRWLIARHCLTRRPPIPCARLDFDLIDPVNAIRHPWLLLVEAAHQLDQQIERSPLHELVRQFDRFRALLHHTTEPGGDLRITGAEHDEVFDRFVLAINETRRAEPVVILLDTLEEVVLKPAEGAGALVELLGRLQDRVPSIRLVLAGRYDLTTRLEGFSDRLGAAPSLEITPFDDDEATRYLTENREIGPPELVEAIVRKCDGLPFTLAVFADLVRADPTLTAADVATSTGPALLYCIVRVLERIEDDRIRWILRYGVAARALDFDFLQNVIRPFLTSAIAGDRTYDQPERDDRPKDRPVPIFVGGRDPVPTTEQDLRALWLRLTDYAASSSWVSQEEADVLVLHPRVRGPLRELLRGQPVFRLLHERAAAYYERRAAEDPERWSIWTRARLYHRFVLDGPAAIGAWREAVAYAHASSRPDWTADLASDLFDSDYLTEDDEPDPALLGHDVLYEANLELARVLAEEARAFGASADSSLWSGVERLVAHAERLLSEHPELGPPNMRLQLLQASLQLARGRPETARTLLDDEPPAATTTAERRDLMLLRAETHERLGDESAVDDLTLAYQMSAEIGDEESTVRIALRMAAQRLEEDLPAAALEAVASITDPGALTGLVAAHRSWATLQLGRPGTVLARLRDENEPWVKNVRAQALLALRTPAAAVAVLEPVLAEHLDSPAYSDLAILCARAYGDQLLIDEAVRLLAPALRNEGPNQAAIAVELSRLMIRAAGNLRHAEEYLRYAEREGTLPAVLVRIEWLGRAGHIDEAEELLGRMLTDPMLVSARARNQISAALAGLMLGTRGATALCLPRLVEQLRRVQPVSARLHLMEDVRHCPPLDRPDPVTLNELTDLLLRSWLSEPKDDLFERDRACLDLLAADVARVLGREDIAGSLRPRALTVLGRQDPFVYWQNLPYVTPTVREASALERRFLDATAHSPTLQGAFLVDLTDTLRGTEPVRDARARLARARELLEAPGAPRIAATARLYDIRAELDNLEEQSLDRYRMAGAAATVWGGLGDEQARRRSLSRAPELASPSAMCGPTSDELTLTLSATGDDTMTISDGTDTFTADDQTPGGTGPEPLLDLSEWPHPQTFRALARWTSDRLPGYGGARDVRLEILTPRLQAFPWELLGISWWPLALHPAVRFVTRGCSPADRTRAEITHLQRCLRRLSLLSGPVDGIVGPLTTHDVTALRQRAELATGIRPEGVSGLWRAVRAELAQLPPRHGARVLILQPDVQRSIVSQRGHRGSAGDIEAIYAGEGLRPHTLQNPSATTLLSFTGRLAEPKSRRFDIVHICATMGTSGGVPHLDFFGKADIVTVTVLHAAIEQLAAGSNPPLVVLDVNAPPTSSETIRQFTLRNEFAAQLLALGGVPVILATGLAEDLATVQQRQTLARTFAGRGTAADACRSLHTLAHGIDTLHRAIPFAGSVLFSSQGPETLLPPGLL